MGKAVKPTSAAEAWVLAQPPPTTCKVCMSDKARAWVDEVVAVAERLQRRLGPTLIRKGLAEECGLETSRDGVRRHLDHMRRG